MSMTLKETLVSCERLYNYTSKEIDLLKNKIISLLENCKSFSTNEDLIKEVDDLLKEVQSQQENVTSFIKKNPNCKEIEQEIERYNQLNNISERVKNKLLEISSRVLEIEKVVIDSEKKDLLNILNANSSAYENSKNEIIKSFKNLEEKLVVKKIFETDEHKLINMNSSKLYLYINQILNEIKLKNEFNHEEFAKIFNPLTSTDEQIVRIISSKAQEQNLSTFKALQYANSMKENYEYQENNAASIIQAITNIGYNVREENIVREPKSNSIFIKATNFDGKEVDFSIRLDGSLVYNFEGFDDHDHDVDFNKFKEQLAKSGLVGKLIENKVYREPEHVRRNRQKLYKKK